MHRCLMVSFRLPVERKCSVCHRDQYVLDLRRSCWHGRMPSLATSWQWNDSVKRGRRRCSLLTAAVAERIVRRKLFGNSVERYVHEVMSHWQVDGCTPRSRGGFQWWYVIPSMAPAGRRTVADIIRGHGAQSAVRKPRVTRHRQWRVVVWGAESLGSRTDVMWQRRRAKVRGVVSRWRMTEWWRQLTADVLWRPDCRIWRQSVITVTHTHICRGSNKPNKKEIQGLSRTWPLFKQLQWLWAPW